MTANVVDFQAVDNLKVMVILLSVFDDILIQCTDEFRWFNTFQLKHCHLKLIPERRVIQVST